MGYEINLAVSCLALAEAMPAARGRLAKDDTRSDGGAGSDRREDWGGSDLLVEDLDDEVFV